MLEILVHTPAPSSAQDDLRWRRCAEAYKEFASVARRRLVVDESLAAVGSAPATSKVPATQQSHDSPTGFARRSETSSRLPPQSLVECEGKLSSNASLARILPRRLRQHDFSAQPKTPHSAIKRLDATRRRRRFLSTPAFEQRAHAHAPGCGHPEAATDPPQWLQMLEIRAPAPTPGSLQLTPELLTTPDLRKLSDSSRHFEADAQTRALDPLERGYWQVDCRAWHPTRQARCWQSLAIFIARDRLAGWGVAGVRDAAWTTIRIYCWGALVAPIYILLSQASEGGIHATGACWIGGDGSTVVSVGPTPTQRR